MSGARTARPRARPDYTGAMRTWPALLAAGACYDPPEFPLITTVPIEAPPGSRCLDDPETIVACTIDGDTFDALACGTEAGFRVRMLGIDAPEVAHDGLEADCGADAAAAELARVLAARPVTLGFDEACLDTYGRTLAYVYLFDEEIDPFRDEAGVEELVTDLEAGEGGEALLVNEWLLWRGIVYPFDEDWVGPLIVQERLDAANAHAIDAGEGLYATCTDGTGAPSGIVGDTRATLHTAEVR